jgi:hypothetical protein
MGSGRGRGREERRGGKGGGRGRTATDEYTLGSALATLLHFRLKRSGRGDERRRTEEGSRGERMGGGERGSGEEGRARGERKSRERRGGEERKGGKSPYHLIQAKTNERGRTWHSWKYNRGGYERARNRLSRNPLPYLCWR